MSLAVGTQVKFNSTAPFTVAGDPGTITEIEGTTYILQMDDGRERYAGAEELEIVLPDFTSWNNYKLVNMLERAIRTGAGDDYIMDLQNEIFSRMTR